MDGLRCASIPTFDKLARRTAGPFGCQSSRSGSHSQMGALARTAREGRALSGRVSNAQRERRDLSGHVCVGMGGKGHMPTKIKNKPFWSVTSRNNTVRSYGGVPASDSEAKTLVHVLYKYQSATPRRREPMREPWREFLDTHARRRPQKQTQTPFTPQTWGRL